MDIKLRSLKFLQDSALTHLREDEHSVSLILEFPQHLLCKDELARGLDQRRALVRVVVGPRGLLKVT